MRTTRLGAVLASLAIPPARRRLLAQPPHRPPRPAATTTKLALNQHKTVEGVYGQLVGSLRGNIADDHGGLVFAGTAVLQRQLPGKGWKNVKSDHDGAGRDRFGTNGQPRQGQRAVPRALPGWDGPHTPRPALRRSPTSSLVTLLEAQRVTASCAADATSAASWARRPSTTRSRSRSSTAGWKRYKVVHTNAKSKWTVAVTAHARQGTLYRAVVGGTKITDHVDAGRFYRSEPQRRRAVHGAAPRRVRTPQPSPGTDGVPARGAVRAPGRHARPSAPDRPR